MLLSPGSLLPGHRCRAVPVFLSEGLKSSCAQRGAPSTAGARQLRTLSDGLSRRSRLRPGACLDCTIEG